MSPSMSAGLAPANAARSMPPCSFTSGGARWSASQRIMVANYTVKGGSFAAEKPRVWFEKQLSNVGLSRNLDLSPDGKRFVVVMSVESAEPRENQSHVMLELNFFDEVRRRVAGGK